jgi:hypothetical protein
MKADTNPKTTAFVGMIGDFPIAVAHSLDAVQERVLTDQTRYGSLDEYDYRWDEYRPGKVWRLMQRRKDRKGRFSWTTYSVHTADFLTDGAA